MANSTFSRFFWGYLTFVFVTVVVVIGTSNDPDDRHVALLPPANLTVYYIGSNNIVVAWDPPEVYVFHDVENATFDEEGSEGILATKHNISLIAVNSSETSENAAETGNSTASGDQGTNTDSDTAAGATSTPDTSTQPEGLKWKCQPFSFFDNFTVAVKVDIDVNDTSMVVTTHDLQIPTRQVSITGKNKIVPFSHGCVINYEVSWEAADAPSGGRQSLTVPPTSRIANITGLQHKTSYHIHVSAVYVSGDKLESDPITNTTKAENDTVGCQCSWHGTIHPSNCNSSGSGTPLCQCKVGYWGQFCEYCAPGYYRTAPYFPCHRCPCAPHTTQVTTCRFVEGFLRCDKCEVGYTGNICHQCDVGYYRYNRHCILCFCNGNTPKNAENVCLPSTGMCINCQHNTTGFNCERCLPGYVGDATTFKNCTKLEDLKPHPLVSTKIGSSVSGGVIAAIIVVIVLVVLLILGVYLFRRYRSQERRRAFWTIEMKRDADDVDFNTVHNDDHRLDDDDQDFFTKRGQPASNAKYARLQEQI